MAASAVSVHRISVEGGPSVTCRADRPVSLEFKRQGIHAITIGCRGGGCGVCRVRVLDGEYSTDRMSRAHVTAEEEAAGYVLACCLYPLSDLHIVPAPRDSAA